MEDNKYNIGEQGTSWMSGCSSFFLTSSVLSFLNGERNRDNSKESAIADEKFQRELQRQKELYEDAKEAEERSFKLWFKERQREFARAESIKRLEADLQKADLQLFFRDWPLQIAIEAVNDKRKKGGGGFMPITIIIGKHTIGEAKDPLSILYPSIIDEIKPILKDLGLNESNIYRFKDKTTVMGGAALANIYSMMSTFPTVVVFPQIDERHKLFDISVGMWNQDSIFPIQKKVLSFDFDYKRIVLDKDYLEKKVNEIKMAYITIASVLNDTYSITEGNMTISFPKFAKQKSLSTSYPTLIDFATKEYSSLIMANKSILNQYSSKNRALSLPYNAISQKAIEDIITKSINEINK